MIPKILFVFGTRPEAIKLAPVIRCLRGRAAEFEVSVCVTAQHRAMLDQVLSVFRVRTDHDLNVMRPGQSLAQLSARILSAMEPVLKAERPDMAIVQGDTTSTLAGALAAFYHRIPVAHVEAGLRTGDMERPFPEEMNRVLTTRLSALHFAATARAAQNLADEGVDPGSIAITGNSGIDAVSYVRDGLESGLLRGGEHSFLDPARKLIVVTAHRRESFGRGFDEICAALAALAQRPDVQIVFPVHPNPSVREPADRYLGRVANIRLIDPLEYLPFVDLMRRAHILITDSGGVQEEGPSLGKPVLVMRDKTERPEAVEAGTARLVGACKERILRHASLLLDDPAEHESMARRHSPYGDGRASERIADAILAWFSKVARAARAASD